MAVSGEVAVVIGWLTEEPRSAGGRATPLWVLALAAMVIAGTLWLRDPLVRYLAAGAVATVGGAVATWRLPRRAVPWAVASLAGAVLFWGLAGVAQRDLVQISRNWTAFRAEQLDRAVRELAVAMARAEDELTRDARRALDAPEGEAAFTELGRVVEHDQRTGVVLYRGGRADAWAGRLYVDPDTLDRALGVAFSPFYVTLYASAEREGARAVATSVVHARPPGDRIANALDLRVMRRALLARFDFLAPGVPVAESPVYVYAPAGDTLLRVVPVAPGQEEAALLLVNRSRANGALVIALVLVLGAAAVWWGGAALGWRLVTLGVALTALALAPLNALSAATVLFDPTVYFTEIGGAFTASVGALMLGSAILVLGLLLALRARLRIRSQPVALVTVLLLISLGPFLMRQLARGVAPPPGGVSVWVWLAWELALFLGAAALLVAAASAGSTALGRTRGLPPWWAPVLAASAALLGPLALEADGGWPAWYPLLWMLAIGAVALTRRHRLMVMTAALVAALGATTLTWNAGVRGRMALAEGDVASLDRVEPDIVLATQMFTASLRDEPPPTGDADLLRQYVASDLAGSGYPVAVLGWSPDGLLDAQVSSSQFDVPVEALAEIVDDAIALGAPVVDSIRSAPGAFVVGAVPHVDGTITSIVVAPRTRLIPDDPFAPLIGLRARETAEAPYQLSLIEIDGPPARALDETRWYRQRMELHGDRLLRTAGGHARAHIEVDLRSFDVLVERGTLIVLLDLLVLLGLWLVSVSPDGSFSRWLRRSTRRWWSSYRARLSLTLFGFFVVPAIVFAGWSYRRLQLEELQSRELLVRQTLRAVSADRVDQVAQLSARVNAPLLLYRGGELWRSSEPLHAVLAPLGRFLPPEVYRTVGVGREAFTSRVETVAGTPVLFGYSAASGARGVSLVLSSPARWNEELIERRQQDLGVLVLFATVIGGLAALWLSGLAARSLAEPIGALRGAARAIAAGKTAPPLTGKPPAEFVPVFSAFSRMESDLGESRLALEAAQRRTSAVLRNVASGVVAVSPDGLVSLANPRASTLLGAALEPGTPLAEVGSAELADRVQRFLAGRGDDEDFEMTVGECQLQGRLTRLSTGGAVLTLDDITELARAQRVLAWGEMARQVAHEIKNPLTPIRLGVQHLLRARSRDDFDAILERNVERILAEIDRLDQIARGFSRYGTLPAERPAPESTDVARVARDVVDLESLGRDGVDWVLSGAERSIHAMARDDELHDVLLNVLENARLAEASRIEVRLGSDDGHVTVEVRDDGRGIASDVLPRIFEPHFSTRTSGSGLGLAISRQLIEGWGGAIGIASQEGEGTSVRIRLRVANGQPEGGE